MNFKSSGTYVRPFEIAAQPSNESRETQVFPAPPQAAEHAAMQPTRTGSSGVSVLGTVGIGAHEPAPPAPPPRPERRAAPPRAANEPTRIFVLSAAHDGAAESDALSRRTAMFASPPFAPVPNVVGSRAPHSTGSGAAHSAAKPAVAASPPVAASRDPLLRAFDGSRERVTTWSTAQTVAAPLTQIAEAVAASAEKRAEMPPAAGNVEAGSPNASRSSPGWLARLRQPSAAMKRIAALVVTVATVASAGSLLGKKLARTIVRQKASVAAAAPAPAAAAADPSSRPLAQPASAAARAPAEGAPAESASTATATAKPAEPAPAAAEPSRAAPTRAQRAPERSTASARGASHEPTLARQAVDALLAGDRTTALQHYRELSQQDPERRVYREAVRRLAPAASSTPR